MIFSASILCQASLPLRDAYAMPRGFSLLDLNSVFALEE